VIKMRPIDRKPGLAARREDLQTIRSDEDEGQQGLCEGQAVEAQDHRAGRARWRRLQGDHVGTAFTPCESTEVEASWNHRSPGCQQFATTVFPWRKERRATLVASEPKPRGERNLDSQDMAVTRGIGRRSCSTAEPAIGRLPDRDRKRELVLAADRVGVDSKVERRRRQVTYGPIGFRRRGIKRDHESHGRLRRSDAALTPDQFAA